MNEIIGAILGAAVGALITGVFAYLATRPKNTYIECVENASFRFSPPPPAQITYKTEMLDDIYLRQLSFENRGRKTIPDAPVKLRLSGDGRILGVKAFVIPERDAAITVAPEILAEEVVITIKDFFPFQLNGESLIVHIFTDAPLQVVSFQGVGGLSDGEAWAVRYRGDTVFVAFIGYNALRSVLPYALLLYFSVIGSLMGLIGYFISKITHGLLHIVKQAERAKPRAHKSSHQTRGA